MALALVLATVVTVQEVLVVSPATPIQTLARMTAPLGTAMVLPVAVTLAILVVVVVVIRTITTIITTVVS